LNFEQIIEVATNAVTNKEFDKAIEYYLQALQKEPKNKKIFYNLGYCYLKSNYYLQAIEYFKEALLLDNKYISAHVNLGITYKKVSNYQKALHHLLIAYKNQSNDLDVLYNLANTYSSLEEYDNALALYNTILQKDATFYKAYYGIGLTYNTQLQYKKAKHFFLKAIEYHKNYPDAYFALSLIQLRDKEYIKGWANYEARWEASNPLQPLSYKIPFYNGEDLKYKTIMIQEEQGFGDNLQFIRYLEFIKKQKPKKIYVALRFPLKKLFEKIDGITIVSDKDTVHDLDYIVSLLSLPRIFKTTFETIPNNIPYLPKVKKGLNKKIKPLFENKKLKVGFAFSGNSDHKNNQYRSIPLEVFETLFKEDSVQFYSLQITEQPKDMDKTFQKYPNITDLEPYIDDFYDSANILNHLDYIVTIDSALAHLVGAYNKPTLLLLPKNAEWRWFDDMDTSPWYPSIKILRQKNLGIWREVIDECASFLKEEAKLLS
jgi:Tfp pilus assembly protein PilF